MSVGVVPSMATFKDDVEAQAIEGAPFVIAQVHFEPVSLHVDIALFHKIKIDSLVMSLTDQYFKLPEVKYPVNESYFCLWGLFQEDSVAEYCISYFSGCEV